MILIVCFFSACPAHNIMLSELGIIFCFSFVFIVHILICSILDQEIELDHYPESLRTMKYYLRNLRDMQGGHNMNTETMAVPC